MNTGSVWSTVSGSCDRLSLHIVGVSLHNDSLNDLLLVLVENLRKVLVKLRLFPLELFTALVSKCTKT